MSFNHSFSSYATRSSCCSLIIRGMAPPPGLCKWEAPGICMVCFLSSSRSLLKTSFSVRLLANDLKLVLPPPFVLYFPPQHLSTYYAFYLFLLILSLPLGCKLHEAGIFVVFFIVVSFAARKVLGI